MNTDVKAFPYNYIKGKQSIIFGHRSFYTFSFTKTKEIKWKYTFDVKILRNLDRQVIFIIQNSVDDENVYDEYIKLIEDIKMRVTVGCLFIIVDTFGLKHYVPPRVGLFELFDVNKNSIYVGDKYTQDNSIDLSFAYNYRIQFVPNKSYFTGADVVCSFQNSNDFILYKLPSFNKYKNKKQELIIMCGPSCSGKTLMASKFNYRIAKDEISAMNIIMIGESVVIDKSNPTHKDRNKYIQIARHFKIPCKIILIDISKLEAYHINAHSVIYQNAVDNKKKIESWFKAFESPKEYIKHKFRIYNLMSYLDHRLF